MGSTPVSVVIVAGASGPVEAVSRAFEEARAPVSLRAVPTLAALRAAARTAPPDVALVSLEPPWDRALEALAVELAVCPFPVVVMTSRCDERTAQAIADAGAVDYILASPEGLAESPRTVERAMREWQQRSARGRGEVGLRATAERLNLALEAAELGTWYHDATRDLATCDERALLHFDCSGRGPVPVAKLFERVRSDDAAGLVRALSGPAGVATEPRSWAADVRVVGRNGETRWLSVRMLVHSSLDDADRRPIFTIGTTRDITERKLVEEALRQANQQFEGIFRAHPDLFFRMEADGTILDYKAGSRGDLYVPPERFLGQRMQAVLPPEVGAQVEEAIRRALTGEVATIEYVLPMPEGDKEFEARVVALEGDQVVTTVRDISERKRAEVERLELERRLLQAQKLESLGVLAGGIAHDFNNLLMAVLGHLDLATQRVPPTAPVRGDLEQAIRATQRATDLTRQMLAYSGRGHFVVAPVDLNALVRENVGLLRAAIPHTVTFDLDLAGRPAVIEADPGQLQQVVMNLITNASEAIADRPGTVTLTTGVVHCDERYLSRSRLERKPAPGRFVVLEVADTGCGMSQGTLDRLFDPFFSTKFTGRGLGMAVVMGIVRGHGGAILVDSVVGRGSAIRVLFPAPGEVRAVDASPRPHLPAEPVTGERSGVILVVEDDASVRELCRQYLDEIGYECLVAASGEEALDLFDAATDRIVAVLLDLSMPGVDGVATFLELARRRPDLKVLMMSGFSESDTARRFPGAAPVAFLHKPFRLAELSAKIQDLLATR